MPDQMPSHCLNCNHRFSSESEKYCSNCGQLRWTKLTLRSLFTNAISSYFSMDSKMSRTFFPFLFQPGKVAKEYIAGKQQKYLSPFQVYVFFSFLMMILATSVYFKKWDKELSDLIRQKGLSSTEYQEQATEPLDSLQDPVKTINDPVIKMGSDSTEFSFDLEIIDSLMQEGKSNVEIMELVDGVPDNSVLRMLYNAFLNFVRYKGRGTVLLVVSQVTIVLLFGLFLTSLLTWLTYRKSKINFAGHLVTNTYYYSAIFLWVCLFILIGMISESADFMWLLLILIEVSLYVTLKTVYGQSWWKTLFKTLFLNATYFLLVLPLSTALLASLSIIQLGQ